MAAPDHTSQSSSTDSSWGSASTVMGVYEPAMSRKMLAWSIRLRRIFARGDQSNRW
jgi:hypothetical protein